MSANKKVSLFILTVLPSVFQKCIILGDAGSVNILTSFGTYITTLYGLK